MVNLFELVENFFNILDSDFIKQNTNADALGEFMPLMQKGGEAFYKNGLENTKKSGFEAIEEFFDFNKAENVNNLREKFNLPDVQQNKNNIFEKNKAQDIYSVFNKQKGLSDDSDNIKKKENSSIFSNGNIKNKNGFIVENFEAEKMSLEKLNDHKKGLRSSLSKEEVSDNENPEYEKIGRYIADKISEAVNNRGVI